MLAYNAARRQLLPLLLLVFLLVCTPAPSSCQQFNILASVPSVYTPSGATFWWEEGLLWSSAEWVPLPAASNSSVARSAPPSALRNGLYCLTAGLAFDSALLAPACVNMYNGLPLGNVGSDSIMMLFSALASSANEPTTANVYDAQNSFTSTAYQELVAWTAGEQLNMMLFAQTTSVSAGPVSTLSYDLDENSWSSQILQENEEMFPLPKDNTSQAMYSFAAHDLDNGFSDSNYDEQVMSCSTADGTVYVVAAIAGNTASNKNLGTAVFVKGPTDTAFKLLPTTVLTTSISTSGNNTDFVCATDGTYDIRNAPIFHVNKYAQLVCAADGSTLSLVNLGAMTPTGGTASFFNEAQVLWTFNTTLETWMCHPSAPTSASLCHAPAASATLPVCRSFAALWQPAGSPYIYMLGGTTPPVLLSAPAGGRSNLADYWRVNISSGEWSRLECNASCPSIDSAPFSVVRGASDTVLITGCGPYNATEDIYVPCSIMASRSSALYDGDIENLDGGNAVSYYVNYWLWTVDNNADPEGSFAQVNFSSHFIDGWQSPFPGSTLRPLLLSSDASELYSLDTSFTLWRYSLQVDPLKAAVLGVAGINTIVGAVAIVCYFSLARFHQKLTWQRLWYLMSATMSIGNTAFGALSFLTQTYTSSAVRTTVFAFQWIHLGVYALFFWIALLIGATLWIGQNLIKVRFGLLFRSHSALYKFLIEGLWLIILFALAIALFFGLVGVCLAVGCVLAALWSSRLVVIVALMVSSQQSYYKYPLLIASVIDNVLFSFPLLVTQSYNSSQLGEFGTFTSLSIAFSSYMIASSVYSACWFCSCGLDEDDDDDETELPPCCCGSESYDKSYQMDVYSS